MCCVCWGVVWLVGLLLGWFSLYSFLMVWLLQGWWFVGFVCWRLILWWVVCYDVWLLVVLFGWFVVVVVCWFSLCLVLVIAGLVV